MSFLHNRYRSNTGGLLCDDMGLGKTVQVGRMGWGRGGKGGRGGKAKVDIINLKISPPPFNKKTFCVGLITVVMMTVIT